jgi:HSP20 family protein
VDDVDEFIWRLSRHLANLINMQGASQEPYVEVVENDDSVLLTAEIPGVRAEDIRVRVHEGAIRLTIRENGFTAYSETFETGRLNPKDASVKCVNGVLEVRVPCKKALF